MLINFFKSSKKNDCQKWKEIRNFESNRKRRIKLGGSKNEIVKIRKIREF